MNVMPIIGLASLLAVTPADNQPSRPRVLVFSRTVAYRHDAIPAGIAAIRELGAEGGFDVDATEDPAAFTRENLGRYRAIVFLNTSGDVLDEPQKAAFQGYIQGGGGLAAVHQGVTTLDKWPWYVALVGGVKFGGHPQVQPATCRCEDRNHPATKSLPESWSRTDEWYNYEPSPRERSHVLMTVERVVLHGRQDGEGPPHLLVSHRREGSRLVHGPGAHQGRLWRTGLPTAPAWRHPVGRGARRGRGKG